MFIVQLNTDNVCMTARTSNDSTNKTWRAYREAINFEVKSPVARARRTKHSFDPIHSWSRKNYWTAVASMDAMNDHYEFGHRLMAALATAKSQGLVAVHGLDCFHVEGA